MDEKIGIMLIGAIVALGGKIIWDWLKNRPNGNGLKKVQPHCEDHADCISRISGCETGINCVQREQTKLATLFDERSTAIIKGLKDNSDKIDTQASQIMEIKEDVAGLRVEVRAK